jgi:hypothetical protein
MAVDAAVELVVTGPITGGTHGWPLGARLDDVSEYGYVEEEFFIDGTASTYGIADGATYTRDGRWSTVAHEPVPFRTRILVRRPVDPNHFNGTVILEWGHVSTGHDRLLVEVSGLADEGYAHVGVSAQRIGVHGGFPGGDPLVSWDPERYGSLNVPSEDLSFGIFSAAAQAVGPKRPTNPVDALGGLQVERVVATGTSQAAQRLVGYINGVHPIDQVIDGFIPLMQAGPVSPLETAPGETFSAFLDENGVGIAGDVTTPRPPAYYRIRDDLDAPVLALNSEVDALFCLPIRRPDDDRYRAWEIPGTAHSGDGKARQLPLDVRDIGPGWQQHRPPSANSNLTSWLPPLYAALRQLDRWIDTGTPPPSIPLIEFDEATGDFRRDEHGNAIGGVRLPHVDAPIATLTGHGNGQGWLLSLAGTNTPFSDDELRALYGDHAGYVAAVQAAADTSVAAGVLLPKDAAEIVAAAEASSILG